MGSKKVGPENIIF